MAKDVTEYTAIRPDCLYPLEALKRITGLGRNSIMAAKRGENPLRVIYKHRHAFIYGKDFIEYILSED